jgi:muconolactone delta-isomerase
MPAKPPSRSSPWLWLLFAASALVTVALFFFPAFVIRPFAYQAPRALWWAMAIRQRAPIATIFTGLLCLALMLMLWRTVGIWRRIVLVVAMLLVSFSAVMARMNYFEWMFHPVDDVRFESASQSKLDAGEMIMTVLFSGDARAYPISEMAYHHIVNDVVGGVPIVATY